MVPTGSGSFAQVRLDKYSQDFAVTVVHSKPLTITITNNQAMIRNGLLGFRRQWRRNGCVRTLTLSDG